MKSKVPVLPLIDLSCLRTFIAVSQTGSISNAAEIVHISQSAASLQIKRLEDMLNSKLIIRRSRGVLLTKEGKILLPLAKDLLYQNNNIINQFSNTHNERPILLGVPHDIVHPQIPQAIRAFKLVNNREIRVVLESTSLLWGAYVRGELDIIVTTDIKHYNESICLTSKKLSWVSARESRSINYRPLPVIFSESCIIRDIAISALVESGIDYQLVEYFDGLSESLAAVAADQGIHALISDKCPNYLVDANSDAQLPLLQDIKVNLTFGKFVDEDLKVLSNHLIKAFNAS